MDISNVDYLENSLGLTTLKEIEGKPYFLDDCYIFGYLPLSMVEAKYKTNKLIIKDKPDKENTKIIHHFIDGIIREEVQYCENKILQTVRLSSGGKTVQYIKEIEEKSNNRILDGYYNYYGEEEEPFAIFQYKADFSELELKSVNSALPKIERKLNTRGMGFYSIDYTRDYSGTLDRDKLYNYLLEKRGFTEGESEGESEGIPYLLEKEYVERSCGKNTLKYRYENLNIEYYNKIASNMEAGDVRKNNIIHLSAYVHAGEKRKHLQETFHHPDVVERGLTRLEISIFGFDFEEDYTYLLEREFERVKDAEVFHIQPGKQQWLNLAKKIDRCFLISNSSNGEIMLVWYGSTLTKHYGGVLKKVTQSVLNNKLEWDRAKKWMAYEFAFQKVPIFWLDMDVSGEDGDLSINYKKLKCFYKEGKTVLTPCCTPTKVYPEEAKEPNIFLPDTEHIQWIFRKEKLTNTTTGKAKLRENVTFKEMQCLRTLYCLSTIEREKIVKDLKATYLLEQWKEKALKIIEEYRENYLKEIELEKLEKELLEKAKIEIKTYTERIEQIQKVLARKTIPEINKELLEESNNCLEIIAFREYSTCVRVVFKNSKGNYGAFFPNWNIKKVVVEKLKSLAFEKIPEEFRDEKGKINPTYFLAADSILIEGKDMDSLTFKYNPMSIFQNGNIVKIQEVIKEIEDKKELLESLERKKYLTLERVEIPPKKLWPKRKKLKDIEEGEYICYKYYDGAFKDNRLCVLELQKEGENGEKELVEGMFLQEKLEMLQIEKIKTPLLVKVGIFKSNRNNKKDRMVEVVGKEL